jgi:hypothetical protein
MDDHSRIANALETVSGVLTDLAEMQDRLKSLPAGESEGAARILDRLSEELAEAAADVRRIP